MSSGGWGVHLNHNHHRCNDRCCRERKLIVLVHLKAHWTRFVLQQRNNAEVIVVIIIIVILIIINITIVTIIRDVWHQKIKWIFGRTKSLKGGRGSSIFLMSSVANDPHHHNDYHHHFDNHNGEVPFSRLIGRIFSIEEQSNNARWSTYQDMWRVKNITGDLKFFITLLAWQELITQPMVFNQPCTGSS